MNKKNLLYIIPIAIMFVPTILYFTNAQEQDEIIIPEIQDTRREYVYCPIDIDTLDKSISYEINGCPIIRVYVEEYDRLTALQKLDIDTQLKANGFTAKEDFKINEFTGRIISDTEVISK